MSEANLIPTSRIERKIFLLRGEKVMLDRDLAELYGVETKVLNQAVKRNLERFPDDFMFQVSKEAAAQILRSQIVTLKDETSGKRSKKTGILRSQSVTLRHGEHMKYRPYAFTEQGVAMLSGVLNSPRAIQTNLAIMRTFVQLRRLMDSNRELARKIADMEEKYDEQFSAVFQAIQQMIAGEAEPKRKIGFGESISAAGA